MRTSQHVIDTKSIKAVLALLPDHWVIRELTERDYGIDLMVEIFVPVGTNRYGETFTSTGAIIHIQVKGTQSALHLKNGDSYSYQTEKKALLYVENFSSPFLLFRVSLSKNGPKAYFLWLQRYIRDVLDVESPDWRESKQKTFAVRIPSTNDVSTRIEKIERIASSPKYIQELVEFKDSYFTLSNQLAAAAQGNHSISTSSIQYMREKARQMLYSRTLFRYNKFCIDQSSITDLVEFTRSLTSTSKLADFADYPHKDNLDLLSSSIDGLSSIESLVAENEEDTIF